MCINNHLGTLVNGGYWVSICRWDLRLCISNRLSDVIAAAGFWTLHTLGSKALDVGVLKLCWYGNYLGIFWPSPCPSCTSSQKKNLYMWESSDSSVQPSLGICAHRPAVLIIGVHQSQVKRQYRIQKPNFIKVRTRLGPSHAWVVPQVILLSNQVWEPLSRPSFFKSIICVLSWKLSSLMRLLSRLTPLSLSNHNIPIHRHIKHTHACTHTHIHWLFCGDQCPHYILILFLSFFFFFAYYGQVHIKSMTLSVFRWKAYPSYRTLALCPG